MKRILIGVVLVAAVIVAAVIFMAGGEDYKSNLTITKKELKPSSFNKADIEGRIKNEGDKTINRVVIKAELYSENGDVLDNPFVMVGPVRSGEEKGFEIKGFADYYKVTKFEVKIDSAQ